MHVHSCVELGSVALIYSAGGKKDDISVWGGRWGGGSPHTRNIPSLPQEINLFERAAGLKIGRPSTIVLE